MYSMEYVFQYSSIPCHSSIPFQYSTFHVFKIAISTGTQQVNSKIRAYLKDSNKNNKVHYLVNDINKCKMLHLLSSNKVGSEHLICGVSKMCNWLQSLLQYFLPNKYRSKNKIYKKM